MSLLTRKPPATGYVMLTEQARSAARQAIPVAMNATSTAAQQAGPIARQAVPMAKTAGQSVLQGTGEALAWATPYADAARAWAAPKLEQSAAAVSENIAPMISDALISAARKIETKPAKRRRIGNAGLLAASLALIAAGAATAISLRKRGPDAVGYTSADAAGSGDSVHLVTEESVEQDWIDPDANGHPPIA